MSLRLTDNGNWVCYVSRQFVSHTQTLTLTHNRLHTKFMFLVNHLKKSIFPSIFAQLALVFVIEKLISAATKNKQTNEYRHGLCQSLWAIALIKIKPITISSVSVFRVQTRPRAPNSANPLERRWIFPRVAMQITLPFRIWTTERDRYLTVCLDSA